jgi:hypothetical protein
MSSSASTNLVRQFAAATLAAAALSAILGACSDIYYDRRETILLGADDAVASNRVTHVADPWPRHSSDNNIAFNGERMQAAVERYRHHDVILPRPYSTSNISQQQLTTITESLPTAAPTATGAPAAAVK